MTEENVIKNYSLFDDNTMDNTIRPESINEYIGQTEVKQNIDANIFDKGIIF